MSSGNRRIGRPGIAHNPMFVERWLVRRSDRRLVSHVTMIRDARLPMLQCGATASDDCADAGYTGKVRVRSKA